jgi:LysM repeat protein
MSTMSIDRIGRYDVRTRPVRHLHAVPAAHDSAQVRLTRRGKLVIVALAVAVIGILAIMFGPSSTASGESGASPETTQVRVMPGHTLWQIAADANPNGDIRATVDDIIRLNALPNASALQMGSEIAVPVY